MRRLLVTVLILAVSAVAVVAQTRPVIDVDDVLAPLRTYYGKQAEWPKSSGFKPYKRLEWDLMQRGGPSGNIPVGAYWDALEQRRQMAVHSLDEAWANLGPYNHGGRARVIRFQPGNPAIMYAGAVSGGIFKSTDSGAHWNPLTDALPNLSVGCFEIDPQTPQILYLGTGEGYYNADAVLGVGLLKSTNGGVTWNTTGLDFDYAAGQAITRLSLDPRNSSILLAGTTAALYRSTDGGANFTLVLNGDIKALVRDPQHPDTLLAAPGDPWSSTGNGVFRSTNNGVSWTDCSAGLPQDQMGRTILAFAPSNSQIVYAGICGTFGGNGSQMLGVYRSSDNGQSWTQVSPPEETHYASQGWYNMALAVKRDNPAVVLSSGLDTYRSTNSGAAWAQKTHWNYGFGDPAYVHADHHDIVFHPTNLNEVWEATDGGLFRSTDTGNTWTEMSTGFVTFQYYAMGNAAIDTLGSYGGTQDNGTFGYHGLPDFSKLSGGDGGYAVVDPTDDSTIYCETQFGHRLRSDDGGHTFTGINEGIDGDGAWVTPMALDPFDPAVLYTTTANGRVWRSSNRGQPGSWQAVAQTLSGDMQVVAPSAARAGRLYAASGSRVYRYDGSGQWINVTGGLHDAWVTRVTPDPVNPNVVYATLSGFGHGHVWRSAQAGMEWQNISGNLPDVPFQDVLVDPRNPDVLYAGSDIGVYYTNNGGTNWQILGEGLPAVRVDDMELQERTCVLRVATHGRGLWEVRTGPPALHMLYPNGGEVLEPAHTITLRWSTAQLGGSVRLEINRSFPSTAWEILFATTPNDGREDWAVGGALADRVRFRVTHLTAGLADTSNADSRITIPGIRLLWPNGGETVFSGRRDTVRFARTAVPDLLRLELNRGYPDSAWSTLPSTVTGDSTAFWVVQLPAGEHARLRLSSTSHPEYTDMSDADFTLRAPQMMLESPAGGETLAPGVEHEIRWSAPEHEGLVVIQLNRAYPSGTWTTLAASTENDGSFLWTPAEPAAAHCRVRISTVYDPRTYVESAADFAIGANAVTDHAALPTQFVLHRPYPNPFNPQTTVAFELPAPARVEARVFNRLGQEVMTLASDGYDAGRHELTFDGRALPSGLYFIRVTASGESQIVKAMLVK